MAARADGTATRPPNWTVPTWTKAWSTAFTDPAAASAAAARRDGERAGRLWPPSANARAQDPQIVAMPAERIHCAVARTAEGSQNDKFDAGDNGN
jgi:hypothetical protein